MQVARDRSGKAGEAHVNSNDGRLARIKIGHLDHPDQVVSPVRRQRSTERRPGRLERLAHKCRCLGPVKPDVSVLAALLRVEGWRHAAYASVENVGVADALLSVVLGVEVILQEDGLVVVAAGVYHDLREEDDAVITLEGFCFELFNNVGVDRAVVEGEVLALSRTDLAAFAWGVLMIGCVLGGHEVQREVACCSKSGHAARRD